MIRFSRIYIVPYSSTCPLTKTIYNTGFLQHGLFLCHHSLCNMVLANFCLLLPLLTAVCCVSHTSKVTTRINLLKGSRIISYSPSFSEVYVLGGLANHCVTFRHTSMQYQSYIDNSKFHKNSQIKEIINSSSISF